MISYRTALCVAVINMGVNVLLAIGKIVTGYLFHSAAMVSDGMHSATDALTSVAVMIGIRLSGRQADAKHPYGCERLECVAAIVLAIVVAMAGVGIALSSCRSLMNTTAIESGQQSGAWLMAAAAIVVKEGMFRYTKWAAVKSKSTALLADAWHQRTDALSSVGSLIGIVGSQLGFYWMDPVAGVAIAVLIFKAALDIFMDAVRKMVDCACDPALELNIREIAMRCMYVEDVPTLRTREFGNRVFVELSVLIPSGYTAKAAYDIALDVKRAVEDTVETVKECAVHIHPSEIPLAPLQNR